MRNLAQALAVISLLSSSVACLADEIGKTGRSTPAQTNGEGPPKATDQKQTDTYRLKRMMDERDWDHRKAGRQWRQRDQSPSH